MLSPCTWCQNQVHCLVVVGKPKTHTHTHTHDRYKNLGGNNWTKCLSGTQRNCKSGSRDSWKSPNSVLSPLQAGAQGFYGKREENEISCIKERERKREKHDVWFHLFMNSLVDFLKDFTYSFLERGKREKYWWVAFCMHPIWGQNLQSRHVPWQGIEPVTFSFVGCHPTN